MVEETWDDPAAGDQAEIERLKDRVEVFLRRRETHISREQKATLDVQVNDLKTEIATFDKDRGGEVGGTYAVKAIEDQTKIEEIEARIQWQF